MHNCDIYYCILFLSPLPLSCSGAVRLQLLCYARLCVQLLHLATSQSLDLWALLTTMYMPCCIN